MIGQTSPFEDAVLYSYNIWTKHFRELGTFQGEFVGLDLKRNIVATSGGLVYFGIGSHLMQYDANTGEIHDLGTLGGQAVSIVAEYSADVIYGGVGPRLFSYNTTTHQFSDKGLVLADGTMTALIKGDDGMLYGGIERYEGPRTGYLFSYDPEHNKLLYLDRDPGGLGIGGLPSMVDGGDGKLYVGGWFNFFSYRKADRTVTWIAQDDRMGGGVVKGPNGKIFGAASERDEGGLESYVFSYDPQSGVLTKSGRLSLGYSEVNPPLVLAPDAKIYGIYPPSWGNNSEAVGNGLMRFDPNTMAFGSWGSVSFQQSLPAGTDVRIDVIDENGDSVLTDVANGQSLAALNPTQYPTLAMKAWLTTGNGTQTPALDSWSIGWTMAATEGCNATVSSAGSGVWGDPNIWTEGRVPGSSDVVLVHQSHQVVMQGAASVRGLCNYGTLHGNAGSVLELAASEFIDNYGYIIGQNGTTASGSQCAQNGGKIEIEGGMPVNNYGTIQGGDGGIGEQCAGNGGSVFVFGRNTTNKGTICAGNGGNISGRLAGAQPGHGGDTHLWGKWEGQGSLINSGIACAGSGGHGNPTATGTQNGGNGGTLKLISLPNVILDNGEQFAGKGGDGAGGGARGRDGRVIIEPQTISLRGPNTRVWGGDIVIFGGDDWTLDLRNISTAAISATDTITLAVGNNGTVDLRGNSQKVLSAANRVIIASDQVLLDDGVTLQGVAGQNVESVGQRLLYDLSVSQIDDIYFGRPGVSVPIHTTALNGGPTTHNVSVGMEDTANWQLDPANLEVAVAAIDSRDLILKVTPSQDAAIGSSSIVTVTIRSQDDPSIVVVLPTKVVVPYEVYAPTVAR